MKINETAKKCSGTKTISYYKKSQLKREKNPFVSKFIGSKYL